MEALIWLVEHHMLAHSLATLRPARRHAIATSPWVSHLARLQESDARCSFRPDGGHAEVVKGEFDRASAEAAERASNEASAEAFALLLTGRDAIAAGVAPGPAVGATLARARQAWADGRGPFNDRASALRWLAADISAHG